MELEFQVLGKFGFISPNNPANARVDKAILVPRTAVRGIHK
jgi:hypothetical protein